MYATVTAAGVRIGAADDCSALDVRAAADVRPSLDEALRRAQLGSWDGGADAALHVAELRARAAAGDVAPDWAQRWAAMIAYADRSGWLSEDGTIVRAHVVDPADWPSRTGPAALAQPGRPGRTGPAGAAQPGRPGRASVIGGTARQVRSQRSRPGRCVVSGARPAGA